MGAEEVIGLLEKYPHREFLSREISKMIGVNERTIRRIMSNLLSDPFIHLKCRELTSEEKKKALNKNINCKVHVYFLGH